MVGTRSWCSLRTRLFTALVARPWLVLYIVVDFALLEFGYFFAGFWTQVSCVSVMVFRLAGLVNQSIQYDSGDSVTRKCKKNENGAV